MTIGWKCHPSRQSRRHQAEVLSSEHPEPKDRQRERERLFTAGVPVLWMITEIKHAKIKGGIENCKRDGNDSGCQRDHREQRDMMNKGGAIRRFRFR